MCHLFWIPVEKLGTGFSIVKSDINGNIERIQAYAAADPAKYEDYFQIVRDDISGLARGTYAGSKSVTKGVLWLKRAMQFIIGVINKLVGDPAMSVAQAASAAYKEGLSKYHGMIVGGAFSIALNVVPSREGFLAKLESDDIDRDMRQLVELTTPILSEVDKFLVDNGQDDPTKA
mmetsp:Transcript_36904/g.104144  ORF Transcript_36904/g.104144 Transcript_36904/m.104144 type:complete len:175 (-) Transcript_36904:109-633(-)